MKLDKSLIPKNTPYCYSIDYERNKLEPIDGYWIKPCPYYKRNKKSVTCKFLKYNAKFDLLLSDQCKVCGISQGY